MAKFKAESSVIIASLFGLTGMVSICLSIIYITEILALVGLGLLFWSATFFLITPSGFVDTRLLISTVFSEYSTFDRIIDSFASKKCFYIPSIFSLDVLDVGIKKMKDPVVYLSTETTSKALKYENFFIQKKFLLSKNKGIVLTPPGLGLMKLIEKKKPNYYEMRIEKICEVLQQLITQDFSLSKEVVINVEHENISIIIQQSIYKGLYNPDKGSSSARLFGCPIISAIGCVLAQTSGKIITLEEIKASKDMSTIQAQFRIVN